MVNNNSFETFVIIFQGRCGSTYLVEALDSHPEIECVGEKLASLRKKKYNADDQLGWANNFLTHMDSPGVSQKGFKTKLRDVLNKSGFRDLLQSLNTRIIHLRRRNVVKLTISSFNSVRIRKKTGDWNIYDSTHKPSETAIDSEVFASWLGGVEKRALDEMAFVVALDLPVLTLFYEDFLCDPSSYFEQIFSFLNVPIREVTGKSFKSTNDDLRLAISNFDELRSQYSGTPYEAMFDEVIFSPETSK